MAGDRVQLKRVAHIYYSHGDLEKTKTFLRDFGMTEVETTPERTYFRGYGDLPYIYVAEKAEGEKGIFKGAAFEAESKEDLEKASKLKGASEIRKLEGPGGGLVVTIPDPWGVPFHVIWGQELVESHTPQKTATRRINQGLPDVNAKARKAGEFQRFDVKSVVPIHKLGHFVLVVPSYLEAKEFYLKNFNLTPSDIMTFGKDGPEVGAFLHLDRGSEFVDHHTIFLQGGPPGLEKPQIHHSAYEVFDVDQEFLAHQALLEKGYVPAWGVGRHILGSQLFDYWHQSGDGFNVEHYADGDLVNKDTPVGIHAVGPGAPLEEHLSIWAPKFGEKFHTTAPVQIIA